MARRKNAYPELKFHKTSGQWCIYHNDKRITLGTDRDKAERRRLTLISEWHNEPLDIPPELGSLTVAEGLELYQRHVAAGNPDKRKLSRINAAIAATIPSHGHIRAASFRGPALREVRDLLAKRRRKNGNHLTRRYINHLVDAIVLAFRWLVAEDHVPPDNLTRLREMSAELSESVGGLESPKIPAVDDATVEKTLAKCPPSIAAMIQVQRATGLRPGELCDMRRCELSTRPGEIIPIAGIADKHVQAIAFDGELIWLYCPSKHKNLHRSKPRVVAIGTEAQRILLPLVRDLDADELVFRSERGNAYDPATYGNAVARACRKAGVKRWGPNRLRKAAAKRVDAVMGKDGADKAAAMLGHSASRQALDSYISEQIEKAVEAAAKAG